MVSRWPKVEDGVDPVDAVPPGLISWTRKTKKTTAELLDTLAGRGDDGGFGIDEGSTSTTLGVYVGDRSGARKGGSWVGFSGECRAMLLTSKEGRGMPDAMLG